jgi:hypothetical protein
VIPDFGRTLAGALLHQPDGSYPPPAPLASILARMAPSPRGHPQFLACGCRVMNEAVSLRFTAAGFVLVYFVVMGAIIFAPFSHYPALLAFGLALAGLFGAALLAVGWFRPPESASHDHGPHSTRPTS